MTPEVLIAHARELVVPFLVDTCDLVLVGNTTSSSGGQTITETVALSDVPCMIESMSRDASIRSASFAGDSPLQGMTHKLFLMPDSDSQAITPEYKITVHARGDKPELILTRPMRLDDSFEVLLTLACKVEL